jgi:integrase
LRLRRGVSGLRRTYVAQYRIDGRQRRATIGTTERLTTTQARERARQILASVSLGHDPQAEKVAKRIENARTLRSMIERYLAAKQREIREHSIEIYRRYLLTGPYFRPLHPVGINSISRTDVAARVTDIQNKHSPHVARQARDALSALFVWAMEEGLAENNPVIGTRKPTLNAPRTRVLTDAELVAIWRNCRDDDYGRIVRLLILLGNRRQEVGGMCWSELVLEGFGDARYWTLPEERSKNHVSIVVPLSPLATTIIRSVPRRGDRDHLFGVRSKYQNGYRGWAEVKPRFDKRLAIPPSCLR